MDLKDKSRLNIFAVGRALKRAPDHPHCVGGEVVKEKNMYG